jgi:large subunit ribosomal protein L15
MNLTDLKPNAGAKRPAKRIGRGIGSGTGKTSGAGHKGDKARGNTKPGFEGGQTPTHRRLPQMRGTQGHNVGMSRPNKTVYAIVNLSVLERFDAEAVVTPELLREIGIINADDKRVKILSNGELTKKLTVHAHHFSKSAQEKISALGGTIELL